MVDRPDRIRVRLQRADRRVEIGRDEGQHFTFLVVGGPIDQALFEGAPKVLAETDPERYARAGVDVFLASYRPRK